MTKIHSFSQDLALKLPSMGNSKILIVDDHPINIQMLYQVFSSDYHVCMATSGKQALDVCVSQHPDLILLDIEMPEMNGFEVCTRLKALPETQDIPVIFVTAHIDEETETRCFSEGAVDFISKPINRNTVRARVKTHLLLKAQSDLLRQLVYLDGLTEVHNRRYFDKQLEREWKLSNRNQTPLSMIMIDVDFSKNIMTYMDIRKGMIVYGILQKLSEIHSNVLRIWLRAMAAKNLSVCSPTPGLPEQWILQKLSGCKFLNKKFHIQVPWFTPLSALALGFAAKKIKATTCQQHFCVKLTYNCIRQKNMVGIKPLVCPIN